MTFQRFNPFSANFTKCSNTLKQFVGNFPTNCLSVFDHFVGLGLKGLRGNWRLFTDLQAGVPDPISMSKELIQKKISERRFLEQLLDGKKLDKFSIPIPIKCDLRKYQQVIATLFLSSQILFLTA